MLGALAGAVAAWIFRRLANLPALRAARDQILGRLLEMRLYFDEPRVVWQAQLGLLRWNGKLLRAVALPALVASFPFTATLWWLQRSMPLNPREPTVVSVGLSGDTPADLVPQPGLIVETKPVRSLSDKRISWRVRTAEVPSARFESGRIERVRVDSKIDRPWVWRFGAAAFVTACAISFLL